MILLVKRDQNINADSLSELEALVAYGEAKLARAKEAAFGARNYAFAVA